MIILASKSPRRKALLEQIGLEAEKDFIVFPSDYKEEMDLEQSPANSPTELVAYLAQKKAENILGKVKLTYPDSTIIGADTFIVLDDSIIGKARTSDQAKKMLSQLSGKTHEVLTGVYFLPTTPSSQPYSAVVASKVRFRKLSQQDIDSYVQTGEPIGKAAGYAIQGKGAAFVESIDGDYSAIVGLPISEVYTQVVI